MDFNHSTIYITVYFLNGKEVEKWVKAFKYTFKILKNTRGFISSMVIMPVIMILLVSMIPAYSEISVVGYIGEKAPNIASVKMMKLEADGKDYFLGLSQGT